MMIEPSSIHDEEDEQDLEILLEKLPNNNIQQMNTYTL